MPSEGEPVFGDDNRGEREELLMALTFPRISITVDDERGMGTQGELSALSLGFGIHQAWIYSAMFGSSSIFQAPTVYPLDGTPFSSITLVFIVSIVVFGSSLLFAAATDQKYLRFYTAKRVVVAAALLTSVGTFAVFAAPVPGFVGFVAMTFAGVATGVGSAVLLLFWGTAYSRDSAASIVMNTAVAIVIAVSIYSLALHIIPAPFSGVLTACLPLLELPLLWRLTPVSYAVRHAVPIFNPLPVKKGPFLLRLGLPVLLFGFALGAMRSISTQIILPSSDLTTQLLALFAGGAATVLLLVTVFSIDKRSHWDFLFRPIIPFIAVTLVFLPSLALDNTLVAPLVLLTGYMCFEALMWVFFGEISQEFRLSPIFVFGTGRGCLALGSLAGSLLVADPSLLYVLTPFGEAGIAVLIMLVMVIAYALLPRVRDIKRIIVQNSRDMNNAIASFNRQSEQILWSSRRAEAPIRIDGTKPLGAADMFGGMENVAAEKPLGWRSATNDPRGHGKAGVSYTGSHESGRILPSPIEMEYTAETSRKSGRFRAQCEAIADRYLLSRRETEVMFMLAKGHNAAYIQDKLCISKSTAKTHISHIYRKLDIHNQQELLAMVEEARQTRF